MMVRFGRSPNVPIFCGAFDPVPCDVYLSAAEIAALGGAWLRLDPGLAEAEATDGSRAGCHPTHACQTTAHGG